mmetsp:Transcript_24869/g.24532  ORF Transcript_24869/g.24532 Transcript_24869/m.24532 type:complete len:306 (+) Transcript_24869:24-941(+)
MSLWSIIVWLGIIKVVYQLGKMIYYNYFCKINIEQYKYGWVAITGASDGIGKGLATEFASRGFKVLLISRNPTKLAEVSKAISAETKNPDIKYLAVDFKYSHRDPENFYKQVVADLAPYNISVLINNVGIGGESKFLINQDLDSIEEMIGINIYPQTMLSYHLIPGFVKRHQETHQRSLIINFSSTAEEIAFPSIALYAATKRYNHFLSEALRYEYSNSIDIATVKPGPVATPLAGGLGFADMITCLKVQTYARSLINNLHAGINYGHWAHSIQAYFSTLIPYQIMSPLMQLAMPLLLKFKIIKL